MAAVAQISDYKQPLSPKDRLNWLAARGHLSQEQAAAGDKLMRHRERGRRVAYASLSGSGGGGAGNLNPLEARLTAERQYDRALSSVGPLAAAVLNAVVIDNLSTEDAGRICGIHAKAVLPVLTVALDVLRHHYDMP